MIQKDISSLSTSFPNPHSDSLPDLVSSQFHANRLGIGRLPSRCQLFRAFEMKESKKVEQFTFVGDLVDI